MIKGDTRTSFGRSTITWEDLLCHLDLLCNQGSQFDLFFPEDFRQRVKNIAKLNIRVPAYFTYTGEWRLTFWPSIPSLPGIPAVPWGFGQQQVVLKHSWMRYIEIIHIYEWLNQLFTFAPVAPVSPCSEEATPFALAALTKSSKVQSYRFISHLVPFQPNGSLGHRRKYSFRI